MDVLKSMRYEGVNQFSARICVLGRLHHLDYLCEPKTAHAAFREMVKNWTQYVPRDYLMKLITRPHWA